MFVFVGSSYRFSSLSLIKSYTFSAVSPSVLQTRWSSPVFSVFFPAGTFTVLVFPAGFGSLSCPPNSSGPKSLPSSRTGAASPRDAACYPEGRVKNHPLSNRVRPIRAGYMVRKCIT